MDSHARDQSTPTSTSELHRQLDLFGEVLQRVRSDYVEKPNDAKLVEGAINGMLSALDPHSDIWIRSSFVTYRSKRPASLPGSALK